VIPYAKEVYTGTPNSGIRRGGRNINKPSAEVEGKGLKL